MAGTDQPSVLELLGCSINSKALDSFIHDVHGDSPQDPKADVKAYSDCAYVNYFDLGLSFVFVTGDGSRIAPQGAILDNELLVLDRIDFYNMGSSTTNLSSKEQPYSTYPRLPITIPLKGRSIEETQQPSNLVLEELTTGKDILATLGEPDRKGGGAGPSHGSIGIWCEWSKGGIMIEFGGPDSRGPHAWEKGKDAVWKVLTLFPSKPT